MFASWLAPAITFLFWMIYTSNEKHRRDHIQAYPRCPSKKPASHLRCTNKEKARPAVYRRQYKYGIKRRSKLCISPNQLTGRLPCHFFFFFFCLDSTAEFCTDSGFSPLRGMWHLLRGKKNISRGQRHLCTDFLPSTPIRSHATKVISSEGRLSAEEGPLGWALLKPLAVVHRGKQVANRQTASRGRWWGLGKLAQIAVPRRWHPGGAHLPYHFRRTHRMPPPAPNFITPLSRLCRYRCCLASLKYN